MFNNLLALDTQVIMYIVIGVVLVGMIVLTIIPQRKRKKTQEAMMNSIVVGTKIMTIGRMVGVITQVNSDNTIIVNVGTELSPTLIVIDKNAIGVVLENVAQPIEVAPEVTDTNNTDAVDVLQDPIIDDLAIDESIFETSVFSDEDNKDVYKDEYKD